MQLRLYMCGFLAFQRSRGVGKVVIGGRMAATHVLDKVGRDILLAFDGGTTVLAIGFDIARECIDLVSGYVKVMLNYSRRFERRERDWLGRRHGSAVVG